MAQNVHFCATSAQETPAAFLISSLSPNHVSVDTCSEQSERFGAHYDDAESSSP